MFADAVDFFIINLKKNFFIYTIIFLGLIFLNMKTIEIDKSIENIVIKLKTENNLMIKNAVVAILENKDYKDFLKISDNILNPYEKEKLGKKKMYKMILKIGIFILSVFIIKMVLNIFINKKKLVLGNVLKYIVYIFLLNTLFKFFTAAYLIFFIVIIASIGIFIYIISGSFLIAFLTTIFMYLVLLYGYISIWLRVKMAEISIVSEETNFMQAFFRMRTLTKGKTNIIIKYFILLFSVIGFLFALLYSTKFFIDENTWYVFRSVISATSILIYYFFVSFMVNIFIKLEDKTYIYNFE